MNKHLKVKYSKEFTCNKVLCTSKIYVLYAIQPELRFYEGSAYRYCLCEVFNPENRFYYFLDDRQAGTYFNLN